NRGRRPNWRRRRSSLPAAQAARRHPLEKRSMAGMFRKAGPISSLLYCTNALSAQKENPGQQIVALPDNLAVGVDYGLTVIGRAAAAAQRLADFMVSPEGQQILEKHGFAPGLD